MLGNSRTAACYCTSVAAGESKNWGGQVENQHGILQQTASYYIIVSTWWNRRSGGQFYMPIKQFAFRNKNSWVVKRLLLIYILFLNKEVFILAEWFRMCHFTNKVKFKFIVLFYCDNRFMFWSKTDDISHDLHVFLMYFLSIQKYIKYHKAYNVIQVQISAEY